MNNHIILNYLDRDVRENRDKIALIIKSTLIMFSVLHLKYSFDRTSNK